MLSQAFNPNALPQALMAMPRLKGGKGQRKGHAVQEKTLLFNAVLMYLCMQACVLCACMYDGCAYVGVYAGLNW